MMSDCPSCFATGQDFVGEADGHIVCNVCFGAGWVDPDRVCSCGRAATWESQKTRTWYCGRLVCDPDAEKKPPVHDHYAGAY